MQRRSTVPRRLLRLMAAVVGGITFLSVFYWLVITSLKPSGEILRYPPTFLPGQLTWEHYAQLLTGQFARWFVNSMIVSLGTVVLVLCISVPAAYGATRYRFRGQTAVMFIILAGLAMGQVATIIPLYFFGAVTGLLDSYLLLILVYSVWMTPLSTWLLRGYFDTIPRELDEAARVDGCGPLGTLVRIVLPTTAPGLTAAAIITFVYAWNEFILAVVLTQSEQMRTVPVGLHRFLTTYGVDWGGITAASVVSLLPVVAVFLLLQRHFISGLTAGTLGGH